MFGHLGTGGQKSPPTIRLDGKPLPLPSEPCAILVLPTLSSSRDGTDRLALVNMFYPGSHHHWLGNAPELYSPAGLIRALLYSFCD